MALKSPCPTPRTSATCLRLIRRPGSTGLRLRIPEPPASKSGGPVALVYNLPVRESSPIFKIGVWFSG